jgi:dienelactone hydrolase
MDSETPPTPTTEDAYPELKEAIPGFAFRSDYLDTLQELLRERQEAATTFRQKNSLLREEVADWDTEQRAGRDRLRSLMGWPLTEVHGYEAQILQREPIGEDALGTYERIQVRFGSGLHAYALWLQPKTPGPHPLIISQHGGQGTPEMTAGLLPWESNYQRMSQRFLARGCAVLAPQLAIWSDRWGPAIDRAQLQHQLLRVGSSPQAVEIALLQDWITWGLGQPSVRGDRCGMCGFSWGGFYALHTAALDERVTTVLSSGYVSDHRFDNVTTGHWRDGEREFTDAEVAALVCPRPLFIEMGSDDAIFAAKTSAAIAEQIEALYDRRQAGDAFRFRYHPAAHDFAADDQGVDFLLQHLSTDR